MNISWIASSFRARQKLFPKQIGQILFAAALGLLMSSCASLAPTGKTGALTVLDVQQGKEHDDEPQRWGGTIVGIENKAKTTVLEIVSRPLYASGRPRHSDVSYGRFFAEINGFLDPKIVTSGRDISMIGKVTGILEGLIGQASYRFPVLDVFEHRVWSELRQHEFSPEPYYFYHDDYWRDWPNRRRSSVRGLLVF